MIHVYEDASASPAVRFHAVLTVRISEHWNERYEAYAATEKEAKKQLRKEVKQLAHALRCADLSAYPVVTT